MNILFFTSNKVCSTRGGTERATISVATGLTNKYECNCYSLYEIPSNSSKENCFVEEFCWYEKKGMGDRLDYLKQIVVKNSISFVVIQGSFIHTELFVNRLASYDCKVVFAHHFEPGSEQRFLSLEYIIRHFSCDSFNGFCRSLLNIFFYPYYHRKSIISLRNNYKETYDKADKVVLLSNSFVEPYKHFAGLSESDKFAIIHNSLSFNEFLNVEDIQYKHKIALIVARFDDKFKNISLALRIWAKVQKNQLARDWCLKIVGHGKDESLYHEIVAKENIPNVMFEGRQNPINYYKEASLFMMTSNSESWGLTLTEAMQFGTVPIAINTYPSLTEIITDQKDGVVVPKGDIDKYVNEMLRLIKDDETRRTMACSAIESSKRFSQDAISDKWYSLFNEISKQQ